MGPRHRSASSGACCVPVMPMRATKFFAHGDRVRADVCDHGRTPADPDHAFGLQDWRLEWIVLKRKSTCEIDYGQAPAASDSEKVLAPLQMPRMVKKVVSPGVDRDNIARTVVHGAVGHDEWQDDQH